MKRISAPKTLDRVSVYKEGKDRDLGFFYDVPASAFSFANNSHVHFSFVGLDRDEVLDLHWHSVPSFVWIGSGQAEAIGQSSLEIGPGQLIYIPSYSQHGFKTELGFRGVAFQFKEGGLFDPGDSVTSFTEPPRSGEEFRLLDAGLPTGDDRVLLESGSVFVSSGSGRGPNEIVGDWAERAFFGLVVGPELGFYFFENSKDYFKSIESICCSKDLQTFIPLRSPETESK